MMHHFFVQNFSTNKKSLLITTENPHPPNFHKMTKIDIVKLTPHEYAMIHMYDTQQIFRFLQLQKNEIAHESASRFTLYTGIQKNHSKNHKSWCTNQTKTQKQIFSRMSKYYYTPHPSTHQSITLSALFRTPAIMSSSNSFSNSHTSFTGNSIHGNIKAGGGSSLVQLKPRDTVGNVTDHNDIRNNVRILPNPTMTSNSNSKKNPNNNDNVNLNKRSLVDNDRDEAGTATARPRLDDPDGKPGLPSLRATTKDRTLAMPMMLAQTKVRLLHQILILVQEYVLSPEPAMGSCIPSSLVQSGKRGPSGDHLRKWKQVVEMLHTHTSAGKCYRPLEKAQTFRDKIISAIKTWVDFMSGVGITVNLDEADGPAMRMLGRGTMPTDENNAFFLYVHKCYLELILSKTTGKIIESSFGNTTVIDVETSVVMNDAIGEGSMLDDSMMTFEDGTAGGVGDAKLPGATSSSGVSGGRAAVAFSERWFMGQPIRKRVRGSNVNTGKYDDNPNHGLNDIAESISDAADCAVHIMQRCIALEHEKLKMERIEHKARLAKYRVDLDIAKLEKRKFEHDQNKSDLEMLESLEVKIVTAAPGSSILQHWKRMREKCINRLSMSG